MRASLKVTLSLLISVVVFSAFSLVAYSGLFNIIETNFYHPRIKNDFQKTVAELDDKISRYHETNIKRYSSGLQQEFITRSFQTNQVAADIQKRDGYFSRLRETYPDFLFCRLLSQDGKRIHYSTNERDLKVRESNRIVYIEVAELEDLDISKVLIADEVSYRLVGDSVRNRYIYSFPVRDSYHLFKGIALFYVRDIGLLNYLLNVPGYAYGELVSVGDSGLIANVPRETFTEQELQNLVDEVSAIWHEHPSEESFSTLLGLTLAGGRYTLITAVNRLYGNLGVLVPLAMFEIAPSMKIILMVSFFLTIFLVVFLVFNLRQDPLLVASQRIKRFQIDFLQEYVDSKETANWDRWKRDLSLKGPVLKKEIKNGLGRINRAREKDIDELIDKSWDEIITILGGKSGGEIEGNSDLARIEAMLQRVVDSGHLVTSGKPAALVEEAEVVEEAEEVEEAEVVEEAEEVEEAEVVEEAEEVEEAEVVEEAEEVEEAEAVEEAEEAEAVAVGEAEVVAEAEEVEEAEVVEEAEEVEEAEAVEEAEEAEAVAVGEAEVVAEAEEAEEVLEELESLAEIESLPADPYEELEALPSAEEETVEAEDAEPYQSASLEEASQEVELEEIESTAYSAKAQKISRVQTLSLGELQEKITRLQKSITVENGVYQIGEGVYAQEPKGVKPELKSLADTVLGSSNEKGQPGERVQSKKFPVSGTGFDIDDFVAQFENPEKKRTQFMALVDISKRIGAVSVALLVREKDAFTSELTLGLGDTSVENLRFDLNDPLTRNYFIQKKTLLINDEIGRVTQLKTRFTQEDLKYLKKGIFFPSHYKNRDAVIFFGFGRNEDLNIDTILYQLNLSFRN